MEHTPPNIPDKNILHMAYDAGKNNVPFEQFFADLQPVNGHKKGLSEAEIFKQHNDALLAKYGILADSTPLIRQMREEN